MNSLEQDGGSELTDGEYVVSSRNGCPEHFRLLFGRASVPASPDLGGLPQRFGLAGTLALPVEKGVGGAA